MPNWNYFGEDNFPKYGQTVEILWSDNTSDIRKWFMADGSQICTDTPCYPIAWRYPLDEDVPFGYLRVGVGAPQKVSKRELRNYLSEHELYLSCGYVYKNTSIVGFFVLLDELS